MTDQIFHIFYKCRQCKKEYSSGEGSPKEQSFQFIINAVRQRGLGVSMLDVHRCGNACIGIADLIGARKK